MKEKFIMRCGILVVTGMLFFAAVCPVGYAARAEGTLEIDVSDVLGRSLPSRIDLIDTAGNPPQRVEAPSGMREAALPAGDYRAYVHVYEHRVPVLVGVADLTIEPGDTAFLLVTLLEGTGGGLRLRDFDFDGDLALDRVEMTSGTDPENPASLPGKKVLPLPSPVLEDKAGWYKGELFARSEHGIGTESVKKLIRRAEKADLDFLAIADRNTFAPVYDPDYKSDGIVLLPAMEWGNEERGFALIYGPRTLPEPPGSRAEAQAECLRVQAQGGVFTVAHPCFPHAPWTWGLSHVNAIQVWCRDWRAVPPLSMNHLAEDVKTRKDGELVHSIAIAAATGDLGLVSANRQAANFYDEELSRGLFACAVAGSGTGHRKVEIGEPLTYVYAKEKSAEAILEGLRLGRTYLSNDADGPQIQFRADVLNNDKIDVSIGGVVPLNVDVEFEAAITGAEGKKLQVIRDGELILTKVIEGKGFVHRFLQHPTVPAAYRVQVIGEPRDEDEGIGPIDMYALSSPIYARDIAGEVLRRVPNVDPNKTWVRVSPEMETNMYDIEIPEP